ncbi:MAG: cytochrome ubiquinol oxidase subunit I [Gammaproteobacteria bacterium]
MDADVVLLSRIQFAFTIAYHIVFPTLTIGLALFLMLLEGAELKTGEARWREAGIFWSRIFALSFGMGVVTGVVLSYELGTNWGRYSEVAGPVVGPLMSYEVLSAFFLEAGFLGIVLFGRNRVGPRLHFFATCMVALGTLVSSFWILSANSFMHTPAGYRMDHGIIQVASWPDAIFNPSFPYRLAHMVTAAYLSTSFVVAAVGAWYLLKRRHEAFGNLMLKLGLIAAAVLAPLQIYLGDRHGLNTLEHQPMKVAAMEGHWHTSGEVPLLLLAVPDQSGEINRFELALPKLASLILTGDLQGVVRGLTEVPPEDRPPVALVFWSFRVMVGCGFAMLALAWLGVWLLWRLRLTQARNYLQCLRWSGPIGFIAVLAGWITTECGRQPWVVQGLLRTAEAASAVAAEYVAISLAVFVVVYAVLFYAFARFFRHLVRKGPQAPEPAVEMRGSFLGAQE